MDGLPDELLCEVLDMLTLHDKLLSAALVCSRWGSLAADPRSHSRLCVPPGVCSRRGGRLNLDLALRVRASFSLLRVLDLSGFTELHSMLLAELLKLNKATLRVAVLRCCTLTDSAVALLNSVQSLEELDLSSNGFITDNALHDLRMPLLAELRKLRLDCLPGLTERALCGLQPGSLLCLQEFSLCEWYTAPSVDESLSALAQACSPGGRLRRLDLLHVPRMSSAALAALVGACAGTLEKLSISDSEDLTDDGVAALRECRALRSLSLVKCAGLTSRGVLDMLDVDGRHGLLESVDLTWSTGIGADAVSALARSQPGLRRLRLMRLRQVDNSAMLDISSHLKGLRELDVSFCTKVDSIGIGYIASGCTQLECLGVSGLYNISDVVLEQFSPLCLITNVT